MDRLMFLEGIVLKQTETLESLRQELQAKTFCLEGELGKKWDEEDVRLH